VRVAQSALRARLAFQLPQAQALIPDAERPLKRSRQVAEVFDTFDELSALANSLMKRKNPTQKKKKTGVWGHRWIGWSYGRTGPDGMYITTRKQRDFWEKLWKHLQENAAKAKKKERPLVSGSYEFVLGTPGVGKSSSMLHLLWLALQATGTLFTTIIFQGGEMGNWVRIFKWEESSWRCFGCDEFSRPEAREHLARLRQVPECLHLLDVVGFQQKQWIQFSRPGSLVVNSSPDEEHWDDMTKNGHPHFNWIGLPTIEEIVDIGLVLEIKFEKGKAMAQEVQDRQATVGRVPRRILEDDSYGDAATVVEGISSKSLVRSLQVNVRDISGGKEGRMNSVALVVDTNEEHEPHVEFASAQVMKKLDRNAAKAAHDKSVADSNGHLFEQLVVWKLAGWGLSVPGTSRAKQLQVKNVLHQPASWKRKTVDCPTAGRVVECRQAQEFTKRLVQAVKVRDSNANLFTICGNFPAVDMGWSARRLVQATLAEKHSFKLGDVKLRAVVETWSCSDPAVILVVAPRDRIVRLEGAIPSKYQEKVAILQVNLWDP